MVYFIVFSCRIYTCNLFWGPQSYQCLSTTVKCFTLFKESLLLLLLLLLGIGFGNKYVKVCKCQFFELKCFPFRPRNRLENGQVSNSLFNGKFRVCLKRVLVNILIYVEVAGTIFHNRPCETTSLAWWPATEAFHRHLGLRARGTRKETRVLSRLVSLPIRNGELSHRLPNPLYMWRHQC